MGQESPGAEYLSFMCVGGVRHGELVTFPARLMKDYFINVLARSKHITFSLNADMVRCQPLAFTRYALREYFVYTEKLGRMRVCKMHVLVDGSYDAQEIQLCTDHLAQLELLPQEDGSSFGMGTPVDPDVATAYLQLKREPL